MRFLSATLTLALASIAVPAFAEGSSAPTKVTDRNSPDYIRCKRLAVTGSLISSAKTCKTNAEWARLAESEQRDAERFIRDGRTGTNQ